LKSNVRISKCAGLAVRQQAMAKGVKREFVSKSCIIEDVVAKLEVQRLRQANQAAWMPQRIQGCL
jgi:hypothetical protein